jgi:hypothetical protein
MIVKSETRTMVGTKHSYRHDGRQYILYRELPSGGKPIAYVGTFNALLSLVNDENQIKQMKADRRNLTGKNQCERLLKHFQEGRSITRLESFTVLGICELSSRIGELKKKGHPIVSEWVKVPNRFGEQVRVRKYYFGREQDNANS